MPIVLALIRVIRAIRGCSLWTPHAEPEVGLTFTHIFAIFARANACMSPGRRTTRGPMQGWSMLPLTVDDLLPLEEYVGRRREYFESHRRYIDRYRRVRIGPRLTLIFENRQTLWFRVQEIVRVARLGHVREVQQELDLYNRLLPGCNLLQAALLIEVSDETQIIKELATGKTCAATN